MGQSTKAEPLKCPRCESTNTKFCYYNNYNKTQPRHFCKGCKRHWTEGGILRNVPIGGGRKNKRLKTSSTTTMITGEKTSSSNSQIVVQSKQNYHNFDPLVTNSTIVHHHPHTQCNPTQWGLGRVECTQTLPPPQRDREAVFKRPSATGSTIVEEKNLCDNIFFEELNFTSPSLPSKANSMANVFTRDHDVPHQDGNMLVVSFSSGNPSSIPTSFQSSNNVSSYMEESRVTTAVEPMTCVSQPWQGLAGTNNCVMDNNMSGYWNWNDIDALVSADDLNIIPWDDERKLKP